jgi:hypothetical protein
MFGYVKLSSDRRWPDIPNVASEWEGLGVG